MVVLVFIGLLSFGIYVANLKPEDGLDFIRQYQPDREDHYAVHSFAQPYGRWPNYQWRRDFEFHKMPDALLTTLRKVARFTRSNGNFDFRLPNGVNGYCWPDKGRIMTSRASEPSSIVMAYMNITNTVPVRTMEGP